MLKSKDKFKKQMLEKDQSIGQEIKNIKPIISWNWNSTICIPTEDITQDILAVLENKIKTDKIEVGVEVIEPETDIFANKILGKVIGKNVVTLQVIGGEIKAQAILVKKDLIGIDPDIGQERILIHKEQNINKWSLTANRIMIWVVKEESGITQKVTLNTDELLFNNTTILWQTIVNLGETSFKAIAHLEKEPKRLTRRIKRLTEEITTDLEDIEIRAKRPGNEQYQNDLALFKAKSKEIPESNQELQKLGNDLLPALGIRIYGEILKRFEDLANAINLQRKIFTKLKEHYQNIRNIKLHLKIRRIKEGGKIIIHYGEKETFTIPGPLENQEINGSFILKKNEETGLIDIKLIIKQEPLVSTPKN